jgi:hypothetical protein
LLDNFSGNFRRLGAITAVEGTVFVEEARLEVVAVVGSQEPASVTVWAFDAEGSD